MTPEIGRRLRAALLRTLTIMIALLILAGLTVLTLWGGAIR